MTGKKVVLFFVFISLISAAVLTIIDSISPLNSRRPKLQQTKYIVLHTTEGGSTSSKNKLTARGEAHYMVDRDGSIYKMIDEDKLARHAGRSLWEGRLNVDEVSIGIEVVGTYRLPITTQQEASLFKLLNHLKTRYSIADRNVVTHSMVAYGKPNKYHFHNHRGRKRCGANFADTVLRKRLGLNAKALRDIDLESGRLVVADKWLNEVLYDQKKNYNFEIQKENRDPNRFVISKTHTAWDIAREDFDSARTVYTFPNGQTVRGDQLAQWNSLPAGTKVSLRNSEPLPTKPSEKPDVEELPIKEIGKHGTTAFQLARGEYNADTTIYFLVDGRVLSGKEMSIQFPNLLTHLPNGTKLIVGYVNGGKVSPNRSAFYITGNRWNSPTTFYRLPSGDILSGDQIVPSKIPLATFIFFER